MATRKILGFADQALVERLDEFKCAKGLRSRTGALALLLDTATKSEDHQVATYEAIFADTRPVIITGVSGAGKTTTVKALLKQAGGRAFVFDASDEYHEFPRVQYTGVMSVEWGRKASFRVVPSPDTEISRVEFELVCRALNIATHKGSLKDWTIVIEEAHRFAADGNLRLLALEARKFTRKVILLTADWSALKDLAPIFSPLPH